MTPTNSSSIEPTMKLNSTVTSTSISASSPSSKVTEKASSSSSNDSSLVVTLVIVMITLICLVICIMTIIAVFCWGKVKISESERKHELTQLSRMQFEIAAIQRQSGTVDNTMNTSFEMTGHTVQLTSDNELLVEEEKEPENDDHDIDDDRADHEEYTQNEYVDEYYDEDEDEEKREILTERLDRNMNVIAENLSVHNNYHCIICLLNTPNMFNYPCGHSCFCSECADEAIMHDNKCPNCRQRIVDCKQIFNGGFRSNHDFMCYILIEASIIFFPFVFCVFILCFVICD